MTVYKHMGSHLLLGKRRQAAALPVRMLKVRRLLLLSFLLLVLGLVTTRVISFLEPVHPPPRIRFLPPLDNVVLRWHASVTKQLI